MKILNNIYSNHYSDIKNILLNANELKIISPFLMESFDDFFSQLNGTGIRHISLTTTLKDNNPDLFKKSNSLYSFCLNCQKNNISYSVQVDNKLHGKIYISLNSGAPLQGIITSANFTNSGLETNHEWGVLIDDNSKLLKLISEINSVECRVLTNKELEEIIKKIDAFSQASPMPKEPKISLTVSDILNKKKHTVTSDKRYFIKPVGVSDEPFSEYRRLSTGIQELHFSKRKPAAVREGDILICYAVGTAKLLGYFEVIEGPYYLDGTSSRWPWEVKAKNLCPEYSERWNTFNNTISTIQASYNPTLPITKNNQGKTLGALNFGADKIQLTEEFASHVLNIMENYV
ncbi:NgoFVII family restriction endonuclease [Bacillus atrophaeus]|uniref:restriction endonuclease PLD domain-containing protein n=1 Tax=Bacillus atrophaeus TaxID=1452 RepID=UPI00227EABCF|nr:restriction endonuclease PLD domain-containing protein [Bacillus atrophaeus]MCY8972166.1 NgoFVII family restriction endonuclease [Bacillus atrophaeus]